MVAKPPPAARPKAGEPGWLQSLAKSLERGSKGDGLSGDIGVSSGQGSSSRETSQERSGEKSSSQKSSRGRSDESQERSEESGRQTETSELCQSQASVASSMELLASQAVSSQLLAMEQEVAASQGAKEGGVELPGTQDLFTQEDGQSAGSSGLEEIAAETEENDETGETGQVGKEDVIELAVTEDLFTQEADVQSSGSDGDKEMTVKTQETGEAAVPTPEEMSQAGNVVTRTEASSAGRSEEENASTTHSDNLMKRTTFPDAVDEVITDEATPALVEDSTDHEDFDNIPATDADTAAAGSSNTAGNSRISGLLDKIINRMNTEKIVPKKLAKKKLFKKKEQPSVAQEQSAEAPKKKSAIPISMKVLKPQKSATSIIRHEDFRAYVCHAQTTPPGF